MIHSIDVVKILKITVSVALILLAFFILDTDAIISGIGNVSLSSFVIAVFVNILTFFVMGWRWHILVKTAVPLPFLEHIAYYLKGSFLNMFTPANIGGDVYRIAVLKKFSSLKLTLLKLILRERILGLYGFLIIFMISYVFILGSINVDLFSFKNPYNYGLLVSLGVLFLPGLVYFSRRLVLPLLLNILHQERLLKLDNFAKKLGDLLSIHGLFFVLILSFCAIALWVVSIKVVANGLGLTIPFFHIAAVAALVELIRLIPITVQGIGLREGTFSYLLVFLGYNAEQTYVVAVVVYLTLSVAMVALGPMGSLLSTKESQ